MTAPQICSISNPQVMIEDELFQETDEAQLLPKLEFDQAFCPEKNPISANTLANLLHNGNNPVMIVDCRFDYEYTFGHIKGAININDEHLLTETFFGDM